MATYFLTFDLSDSSISRLQVNYTKSGRLVAFGSLVVDKVILSSLPDLYKTDTYYSGHQPVACGAHNSRHPYFLHSFTHTPARAFISLGSEFSRGKLCPPPFLLRTSSFRIAPLGHSSARVWWKIKSIIVYSCFCMGKDGKMVSNLFFKICFWIFVDF